MRRILGLLMAGALLLPPAAHAVTVSGMAYLWGRQDHSGTQVLFTARSPSARTDSTYADSTGYFGLDLAAGIYDVWYTHDGFAGYQLRGQSYLHSIQLDPVTLLRALSGYINGSLAGDYQVVDTIRVADRAYVYMAPGTRLLFDGPYPFIVNGWLEAVGTELDSVYFMRRYPTDESRWGGIRFVNNPSGNSCRMEHCVVEGVNPRNTNGSYLGGGILVEDCSPQIGNSAIRMNSAGAGRGGGIALVRSSGILRRCIISGNTAQEGGGILVLASRAQVEGCEFSENDVGFGNYGGGVACWSDSSTFTECRIERNGASNGAGISCGFWSTTQFFDCLVSRNESEYAGFCPAAYIMQSAPTFLRCRFVDNRTRWGGIIECSSSNARFERCTIARNQGSREAVLSLTGGQPTINTCIVAFNQSTAGIEFSNCASANVVYSCVRANGAMNFLQAEQGPPGIGIVALTNANGDSCDSYYNIFLEPQFANMVAGDYHLTAGSPCIDAGDPGLARDPDGTVADMGAFYYDQVAVDDRDRPAPSVFTLEQNYPNPFNAATRIGFELARAGEVKLEVFDITGRLVKMLVDGRLSEGRHEVDFDARGLPSGVYVYRLDAGNAIGAKKMVALK